MTSRVQKGSTVFKPVAKVRGRTAPSTSRQPSAAIDLSQPRTADPANITSDSSTPTLPTATLASAPQEHNTTTIEDHGHLSIVSNKSLEISHTANNLTPEPLSIPPPRAPTVPPTIRSSTPIAPRLTPAAPVVVARPNSSTPLRESHTHVPPQNSRTLIESPSFTLVPPTSSNELPTTQLTSTLVESTTRNEIGNDSGLSLSQETTITPATSTESDPISTQPEGQEQQADAPTKPVRKRKTPAEGPKKTAKRRRSTSGDAEDAENSQDGVSAKKSRRASSGTPRPRKRAPSPPPYDPDADPGEDIDPTTVTMASLCSDTGQGRVSKRAAEILSNHAAWKIKNREKRARMKATMEAKKYGREEEDPDANPDTAQTESLTNADKEGDSAAPVNTPAVVDDTGSGFDYSQDLATSRYNVQVRIGPNGETVIDEESLVVDRVENDGTANYTHITESDHTKFVNSGSYGKRYRGSRWSAEETELFYDALAQYGENYELIAYVLPGRDRKSCKNKFKVEDKRNPARINHCLNNSTPIDMKTLSRMTGKDFSGPVPEIRVPTPMPTLPPPDQESLDQQESETRHQVKKRSRSKSRGIAEAGVVVLGDADNFESNFDS